MALDAGAIATGVATGIVTQKAGEAVNKATQQGPSYQDEVLFLLRGILDAVGPKEKENINRSVALQPYPYEYMINEDWHSKSHLCIFFHDSTPIRFDVEGIGTYQKTVGPGWVQCDVRGRLSTTDSQNHNVIISYREDALGAAL
jgi:hypothetical protein